MAEDWLKLYRKLAESELWLREKFSRGQAWIDLLLLARWKKGYTRIRGVRVDLEPGQLAWSEVELAKRWQWNRRTVSKFLEEMEQDEQQITQQKNNVTTIISITNWSRYQEGYTAEYTTKCTANYTADCTAEAHKPSDNGGSESSKKGKKDKKGTDYPADFERFWSAYPVKKKKKEALKAWSKTKQDLPPIDELVEIIEKNKRFNKQWLKDGGQFIPHPATWLNAGQWLDELESAQSNKRQKIVF